MLVRFGILQILLVLLTMWIAAQRGRNAGAWGIAALFLPLVALLVLVILPPVLPVAVRQSTGSDPVPVCNQCGKTAADAGARYCTECGAKL